MKILIAVTTLKAPAEIASQGLRCLEGWYQRGDVYTACGKPMDEAYNSCVDHALKTGSDFLLTVDDDQIIGPMVFAKLWSVYKARGPRCIVGAWYPRKVTPRYGAAVIAGPLCTLCLPDDGRTHEVIVITQGFTLFPTAIFRELERPWFVSSPELPQEAYFSRRALAQGWKLLVDTSARIKHVCRETGSVYA